MDTPKVRVGFLSLVLHQSGGTETWHKTLWKNLDRERVEIAGMAVLNEDEFHESTADKLRKIAPVAAGRDAAESLARRCDVLVMWGISTPQDYVDCYRLEGPKAIFVSHGCANCRWTCRVIKAAHDSGCIDQFVAVSQTALDPITQAGASGVVIHNGVDVDKIQRDVREWSTGPFIAGRKTLGFVGRLSTEKRPECLVEAITALPEDWNGVFVGKDYLGGRIQALAERRCPGRVLFVGQSDVIGAELSGFDALLVPSLTEGFGYQIVEAWAAGVPVISTPVGIARSFPDLVRSIPALPTGLHIAQAVKADEADLDGTIQRARYARDFAACHLAARGFGTCWTDQICELSRR